MNVFVSHAIAVGLAILVVIALVLSLNSIGNQWSGFLNEYEPKHICAILQNSVETMHGSDTLGKMFLSLPKKIGGSDYSVSFENTAIRLDTEKNKYRCDVDAGIYLSGKAYSKYVYLESDGEKIEIRDV